MTVYLGTACRDAAHAACHDEHCACVCHGSLNTESIHKEKGRLARIEQKLDQIIAGLIKHGSL